MNITFQRRTRAEKKPCHIDASCSCMTLQEKWSCDTNTDTRLEEHVWLRHAWTVGRMSDAENTGAKRLSMLVVLHHLWLDIIITNLDITLTSMFKPFSFRVKFTTIIWMLCWFYSYYVNVLHLSQPPVLFLAEDVSNCYTPKRFQINWISGASLTWTVNSLTRHSCPSSVNPLMKTCCGQKLISCKGLEPPWTVSLSRQ